MTLETPRLAIRRLRHDDLGDLLVVHGSDDVTRYLPYVTWRTPDDAEAWYQRTLKLEADGAEQYVIELKGESRVVGTLLLFRFDVASRRAELGYVLGETWWRRGLMREALSAFLDYAFVDRELRRLVAVVDVRNTASAGLLAELGFSHEGCLREHVLVKGELASLDTFALLRDDPRPVPGRLA